MSEPDPKQPRKKEGVEEPAAEPTDGGLSKTGGGRARPDDRAGGMLGEAESGGAGGMLGEADSGDDGGMLDEG